MRPNATGKSTSLLDLQDVCLAIRSPLSRKSLPFFFLQLNSQWINQCIGIDNERHSFSQALVLLYLDTLKSCSCWVHSPGALHSIVCAVFSSVICSWDNVGVSFAKGTTFSSFLPSLRNWRIGLFRRDDGISPGFPSIPKVGWGRGCFFFCFISLSWRRWVLRTL